MSRGASAYDTLDKQGVHSNHDTQREKTATPTTTAQSTSAGNKVDSSCGKTQPNGKGVLSSNNTSKPSSLMSEPAVKQAPKPSSKTAGAQTAKSSAATAKANAKETSNAEAKLGQNSTPPTGRTVKEGQKSTNVNSTASKTSNNPTITATKSRTKLDETGSAQATPRDKKNAATTATRTGTTLKSAPTSTAKRVHPTTKQTASATPATAPTPAKSENEIAADKHKDDGNVSGWWHLLSVVSVNSMGHRSLLYVGARKQTK